MPRISIVIPIYNAARFLTATLESLTMQSYSEFEVVCVDDGSTDKSPQIVESFTKKDDRFKYISRPNSGIVGALNDGLRVAIGSMIARLDADDLCRSDRLERQISFLDAHHEVVAVGSSANLIDKDGRPLGEFPVLESHEKIVEQLLTGNSAIHHPSVMIRSNALQSVGAYREGFCPAEDYDLWLRLSEVGGLANINETLITKRQTVTGLVASNLAKRNEVVSHALAEAWVRRKMSGSVPEVKPSFSTHYDIYLQWGWMSLRHGYLSTAKYYAAKVVMLKPWALRSWRLIACVTRGY